MSFTDAIRIFELDHNFDRLVEMSAFPIRQMKAGKKITDFGLILLNELYGELTKRKELHVTPFEKIKYREMAKKTGETDPAKLKMIARSIYLCEKI